MTITITNRILRQDVALGLVRVERLKVGSAPAELAAELTSWVARRRQDGLSEAEDARRQACRDMLRNGKYKPTGRGKPASEYLLRQAAEDSFPRINGPVDANNLISLASCLPISLWDLDLAGCDTFEFRLGKAEERYIFNPAGQELELQDLICGCQHSESGCWPIVTPIKDSMRTKLVEGSTRVAGCIYSPAAAVSEAELAAATGDLLRWLLLCGPQAAGTMALALPEQEVVL